MKLHPRRSFLIHGVLAAILLGTGGVAVPSAAFAEEELELESLPPTAPMEEEKGSATIELESLPNDAKADSTDESAVAETPASEQTQQATAESTAGTSAEMPHQASQEVSQDASDEVSPEELTADGRKLRHPRFQYERPAWAVHLQGALSAFGPNPSISGRSDESIRAAQLLLEWQPKSIQIIGVLGLGLTLSNYLVLPQGELTSSALGLVSAGAQARYQFRYFRNQWVVPYAGVGQEYIRYQLSSGTGSLLGLNTFAGAMLLLNALEPGAAAEAYATSGILRTYLSVEYRSRSGAENDLMALNAGSYYAGLRFEF